MIKKFKQKINSIIIIFLFSFVVKAHADESLKLAIENDARGEKNQSRDLHRNPYETLSFFEIDKQKKILEVVPGRGWYTEILSNYMDGSNNLFVLMYGKPRIEILKKIQKNFKNKFSDKNNPFGQVKEVYFSGELDIQFEKNFFDIVLTFRNSHNWLQLNKAEKVYNSISKIMKKGAILGVVQHRASKDIEENFINGYVKEDFLISLIEKQGFRLIEKSEINSNPKDLKNYEKGVWTLPPRFADGVKTKYLNIGESDRMTLKFKKL